MRLILLCNNCAGRLLADRLKPQGEEIAAAVLHPERKRKLAVEIFRRATNFPMEMFLPMGMIRRKLYESLAVLRMGQECILLGRVRA